MSATRNSIFAGAAVAVAILLCASIASRADEDVQQDEDDADAIEEIIVYANKPGDKVDLDARYEELFRSRAAVELDKLKVLDEEYQWRKSMSENESRSRIKWGYNPEAEMSMCRDTSLTALPIDNVAPATLIRVQF